MMPALNMTWSTHLAGFRRDIWRVLLGFPGQGAGLAVLVGRKDHVRWNDVPTLGVGWGTESEGCAGTGTRFGVGQHLVHLVLGTQQTRSTRWHTGKSGLDLFLHPFLQQLVKMHAMLNRAPSANQSSGLNNHATTVKLPVIYFYR